MSTVKNSVFGENLRTLRSQKGLSQAEMAKFLGYRSQQGYQRYESGIVPSHRILHQIANALDVSTADLLHEEGVKENTKTESALELHPKIEAQAQALMDEEGFTTLKELVTFLVKEETKRRS